MILGLCNYVNCDSQNQLKFQSDSTDVDVVFDKTKNLKHSAVAIIPSLSKTSSSSNQTLNDGSFTVQGPKLWNKVPTEVKAAKSFDGHRL